MCKGKGRENRNLHGKVRNIQPLWMVCGVKQLLMRVFRAPTHPFQAHHCRQRQLLPPCLVPHSSPGWLLLAVRPGWAFCPLLFHTINTLKLYTRHFLFEIGNRIAGYVSRYHCSLFLSPGVQSLSSAQKGKVKCRSPGQDYQVPPSAWQSCSFTE